MRFRENFTKTNTFSIFIGTICSPIYICPYLFLYFLGVQLDFGLLKRFEVFSTKEKCEKSD
jgi:hypothetical protein